MSKSAILNNKNLRLIKLIEVIKYLNSEEKTFLKEYLEKYEKWEEKFDRLLKNARNSFKKYLVSAGYNPDKLTDKDIERIIDEL